MIAVLIVSSGINSQLDQQRAQAVDTQTRYDELKNMLDRAAPVAESLNRMSEELHSYNVTLSETKALGFANLTGAMAVLKQELVDRTAFIGFHVTASMERPVDTSGVGQVLPFDQNDPNCQEEQQCYDTTGGWNYANGMFTVPVSGVWRFHAEGMVRAMPAGTMLNQVGLVFSASAGCAGAYFYRKASIDYSGSADYEVGPALTLDVHLAQGGTIVLCGWGSGTGSNPAQRIAFGIAAGPGMYHQPMSLSGQLMFPG